MPLYCTSLAFSTKFKTAHQKLLAIIFSEIGSANGDNDSESIFNISKNSILETSCLTENQFNTAFKQLCDLGFITSCRDYNNEPAFKLSFK
jgi:hypothetical protein